MIASGELVYVVPRDVLFPAGLHPAGAPHGFFADGLSLLDRIYAEGHFADRARVEEDPSLKQIIPYAVVTRGDEVFRFRRRGGGEKRLVGKSSIGVGGHINPEDAGDVIQDALRRELDEEIHVPSVHSIELIGLLNDDTTAVGSVHLGVVARVRVAGGDVSVREQETMEGAFVSRPALFADHAAAPDAFESWSSFLIEAGSTLFGRAPVDA